MLMPLCSKEDIVEDIHTVIKKEGQDVLKYELPNDHELIIEVIASEKDDMEISVERLDEYGNTIECSTDDYSCNDKCLIAMIENALLA